MHHRCMAPPRVNSSGLPYDSQVLLPPCRSSILRPLGPSCVSLQPSYKHFQMFFVQGTPEPPSSHFGGSPASRMEARQRLTGCLALPCVNRDGVPCDCRALLAPCIRSIPGLFGHPVGCPESASSQPAKRMVRSSHTQSAGQPATLPQLTSHLEPSGSHDLVTFPDGPRHGPPLSFQCEVAWFA